MARCACLRLHAAPPRAPRRPLRWGPLIRLCYHLAPQWRQPPCGSAPTTPGVAAPTQSTINCTVGRPYLGPASGNFSTLEKMLRPVRLTYSLVPADRLDSAVGAANRLRAEHSPRQRRFRHSTPSLISASPHRTRVLLSCHRGRGAVVAAVAAAAEKHDVTVGKSLRRPLCLARRGVGTKREGERVELSHRVPRTEGMRTLVPRGTRPAGSLAGACGGTAADVATAGDPPAPSSRARCSPTIVTTTTRAPRRPPRRRHAMRAAPAAAAAAEAAVAVPPVILRVDTSEAQTGAATSDGGVSP